jgi:hypothetical protein
MAWKADVRRSFFEKKEALRGQRQKNFTPLRAGLAPAGVPTGNQSFFCFFFVHKKEDSSSNRPIKYVHCHNPDTITPSPCRFTLP